MYDRFERFVSRFSAPMLALGMAFLIEAMFTIEWSYPYCSNPDSGSAYSVTGMPLPDKVYGGVSSLEYLFMPHVYAANLLLLAAPLYLLYRLLLGRRQKISTHIQGVVGLASICVAVTLLSLSLYARFLIPVGSIADGGFMRYQELRPVSFGLKPWLSNDCTPSGFWFPRGWKPR
jgi:hypothetical protein